MPDGKILVNSSLSSEEASAEFKREITTIPAGALAKEILGRPVPNTALLAAFFALTGILSQASLQQVLQQKFKGSTLDKNLSLIIKAAELVSANQWKEA
jgi:pyruvate ferredoxin oxidoreductase gamma subunit